MKINSFLEDRNYHYRQTTILGLGAKCSKGAYLKIIFSYFSYKTYVVGTQKNRLNETFFCAPKTHVKIDG